jgi:hypothetical protein
VIAQQLFQPAVLDTEEEEALGEEDLSLIHHRAPSRTQAAGPETRSTGHSDRH